MKATTENFRPLPNEFILHGYVRELVERKEKGVIYRAYDKDDKKKEVKFFEVFVIKIAKAATLKFKGTITNVPDREKLPADSDFGTNAWVLKTEETARKYLQEIEDGVRPQKIEYLASDDEPILEY